jgi:endoglucanase
MSLRTLAVGSSRKFLLRWVACAALLPAAANAQGAGYWHTSGSTILDSNNKQVRIAGVNWYGFETGTATVSGLTVQDYKSILTTIKTEGFNSIRIPLSSQVIETPGTDLAINYSNGAGPINTDLKGLNSLQVLDKIVDYAGALGLKIILDHHRSDAGASAEGNGLWYTAAYPESAWIADWVALANRYAGNPAVIGFDLHNEPHLAGSAGACWDCGGASDWHLAAERAGNAVLGVNPNLLIFVEGVNNYGSDWTWWGGNLEGVAKSPVVLSVANRLVYSAHDYGPSESSQPWFNSSTTYASLVAQWNKSWAYISEEKIAPVWIGEFGTTNNASDLQSAVPGSQGQWFQSFMQFLGANENLSWSYWALNGEDSYGLLDFNYDPTPVSATKQAMLAAVQMPLTTASTLPAAPTGLTATALSVSQVALKWTPIAASGATYNVYFGTTSGSTATLLASGLTSASYQANNLNCCTLYYFTVKAVFGGNMSAASAQVSARTSTPPAPAAPTGLNAVAASTTLINLGWVASATVGVAYTVYSGTSSSSQTNVVASGITATSAAVSGLTPSTKYYFEVKATNQGGTSAASNVASATTKAPTVPVAPSALTAKPVSATEIDLSWTASASTGVTYNVYGSTTPGGTGSLLGSGNASTTFQATGLKASTTYYFTVRAVSSGLISSASNSASATTPAPTQVACHVAYNASDDWGTGFVAAISITNTGTAALTSWKLAWTYSGNQQVTQSWDGSFTQTGEALTLTNASYNGTIAPNATSTGIGFQATYTGKNVAPTVFYLNGVACK